MAQHRARDRDKAEIAEYKREIVTLKAEFATMERSIVQLLPRPTVDTSAQTCFAGEPGEESDDSMPPFHYA